MGSLEIGSRQRDHLPALNLSFKDGPGLPHRSISIAPIAGAPATPLISPKSSMYPGQSLPYPYTPTTSSGGSSQSGYFTSLDSHRAMEEREKQNCVQPQRQSLPSIHEALGRDNPLPPSSGPPTSNAQSQPTNHTPPSSLSSNLVARTGADGPSVPQHLYSNAPPAGPVLRESSISQLQADASRSSLASASSQGSRNASINSPTHSSRTGITSIAGSQGSSYDYGARTSASSAASGGYGPLPQSFSFQQPHHTPPYPAPSYEARLYPNGPWRSSVTDQSRMGEVKGEYYGHPGLTGASQTDSVKRHLDIYDAESPLNEISEASMRVLEFSQHFAAKAHQTQRSGPLVGSLPSLGEIDDMLHLQRRNQEALLRLRATVVHQEHALAEQQMAQNKVLHPSGREDGHMMMYQEELKGSGGFAGPDSKKRRGKAAPPGRCHSCNREETPEWRRGPDGARTLCNACGLHYAKLSRKMGADKASFLVANLRPKGEADNSPSPRSN